MSDILISRRRLLKTAAAGAALGVAPGLGAIGPAAAAGLTMGIIYVGPRDDFGWNQAHAVAAKALKAVPGITVVEEENVPETIAVQKTMESMIKLDGAKLIFATSFGYFDPHMIEMAKKFPDVEFRHAIGLWQADKHPKNAGSYYAYLHQAHYVDGIAAGLSTKTNKLGFIAAKPISSVLTNINAFALGVRKVNPNATIQLIFTGDWALPVREAEAANALADAGCDVLTCHVDSPKVVIETAEKRGIKCCGHNASQASLAPKGFITGAEYKWETIYKNFADLLAKGQKLPNFERGGYDKDYVQNTAFGAGATDAAKAAATAAIADLKANKPYVTGPIKDNKGKEVVAAGKTIDNYDNFLETTNYLVEGIVGSLT
ncbi:ABC transporter substrate-binding protein [Prosthecomicrobium hirschii]|uniref:ABC transporter substrate-binding protein n=1 Tax=Prosthecodimorpha hirschii TaxID=665126 RepID=A0A0P6VUW5_9HYPH|nr:BMP family ABC transporter substrate-binding protein [Prosthecomicrobium hirschii]KPL54756.1 ABC transporter substrate-binding protein [Prosthecomicrobium hirschii]TPQ50156.1 BMP family ABC transporter substrate-binding protein [Prosthecomicrobium hirschii]